MATLPELAGCSRAPAPAVATATPAFMAVSNRLTGYGDLDAMLGGRMMAILRNQSPAFDSQLEALHHALPAIGQPLTLDALPAGLKATAMTILRGWQTGVVGEGAQAQVVSYEDTLMYRPIADVCVLPTYARGEPHYWAHPLHLPEHA